MTLWLCVGGAASGQPSTITEHPNPARGLSAPITPISDLPRLWQARQEALEAKDAEAAKKALAAVADLALDNGIMGLDAYAEALLREALDAAERGEAERATRAIASARALSPALPAVEEVAAVVAIELSAADVVGWISHNLAGWRLRMARLPDRQITTANLWLTGVGITLAAVALFFLVQIGRYGYGIYVDLGQVMPGHLRLLTLILALGGVGALIWAGYGPLLWIFPLVTLLWPYQRWAERAVSVVMMIAAIVAPWGLQRADRDSESAARISRALDDLQRNPWDERAAQRVAQAAAAQPEAWWLKAIQGRALKARGQLDEAIEILAAAEALTPEGSAAQGVIQNNLANALFATGRVATAEKRYLKAKVALPQAPEPRFNLHRLYARTAQAQAAEAQLKQASALGAEQVARWVDEDQANYNRYVKDLPLGAEGLALSTEQDQPPGALARSSWLILVGPVPWLTLPVAALMALLGCGFITARQSRLRLTRRCPRCGVGVRQQIPTASKRPDQLCDTCTDIFVRGVPMERRLRFAKESQIDRRHKILSWGTAALGVLPGLAPLSRGRPVLGAILLCLGLAIVARLVYPVGPLYPPGALHVSSALGIIVVGIIVWITSVFVALRLSRRAV